MPRPLTILRFHSAIARCLGKEPAGCSTVPARCKRLLAAGRDGILGCDDSVNVRGAPRPGDLAASPKPRRGGRTLDASEPARRTFLAPTAPRGGALGGMRGAFQATRARKSVPPHQYQPAEKPRRHHEEPTKRSALGGPAGACS